MRVAGRSYSKRRAAGRRRPCPAIHLRGPRRLAAPRSGAGRPAEGTRGQHGNQGCRTAAGGMRAGSNCAAAQGRRRGLPSGATLPPAPTHHAGHRVAIVVCCVRGPAALPGRPRRRLLRRGRGRRLLRRKAAGGAGRGGRCRRPRRRLRGPRSGLRGGCGGSGAGGPRGGRWGSNRGGRSGGGSGGGSGGLRAAAGHWSAREQRRWHDGRCSRRCGGRCCGGCRGHGARLRARQRGPQLGKELGLVFWGQNDVAGQAAGHRGGRDRH